MLADTLLQGEVARGGGRPTTLGRSRIFTIVAVLIVSLRKSKFHDVLPELPLLGFTSFSCQIVRLQSGYRGSSTLFSLQMSVVSLPELHVPLPSPPPAHLDPSSTNSPTSVIEDRLPTPVSLGLSTFRPAVTPSEPHQSVHRARRRNRERQSHHLVLTPSKTEQPERDGVFGYLEDKASAKGYNECVFLLWGSEDSERYKTWAVDVPLTDPQAEDTIFRELNRHYYKERGW
jgi:hypothetical protein